MLLKDGKNEESSRLKARRIIVISTRSIDYQCWKRFEKTFLSEVASTTYIHGSKDPWKDAVTLWWIYSVNGEAFSPLKMLQRIHRDLWKIFLSRHRRSINPCKYLRGIRATDLLNFSLQPLPAIRTRRNSENTQQRSKKRITFLHKSIFPFLEL